MMSHLLKEFVMSTIVFVGLGHMGRPMVKNLLAAGHEVYVHDVNADAVKALASSGAKAAASLADVTKNADIIFTMVQTGQQVKDLCLDDEQGLFKHAKPNTLYIDCSSIDIVTTRELHLLTKEYQIRMLDCPVSGGVAGAEAGSLTLMAGGTEKDFNDALPILQVLGKKIVYAGKAGSGQAAKICNNLLLGISMIAVSEAFTLAEKLGLDPKKFFEISSHASGQCWSMTSYCPVPGVLENVPANKDYEPGFMTTMMLKDLRLGQHAAEAVDAVIPLGGVAAELYEMYANKGFGEKDFSGIINLIASKV
jgi:3-hydroxyisobutyrate dehydrogenase